MIQPTPLFPRVAAFLGAVGLCLALATPALAQDAEPSRLKTLRGAGHRQQRIGRSGRQQQERKGKRQQRERACVHYGQQTYEGHGHGGIGAFLVAHGSRQKAEM